MKKSTLFIVLFLSTFKIVYAQWDRGGSLDFDDEENMTIADVGISLMFGLILAAIGYLIMQIKSIEGLGKVLVSLGAIAAVGSIIVYLLQIIGMILSVALSFAVKAVLVVGVLLLAIWVLKGIYDWFTK